VDIEAWRTGNAALLARAAFVIAPSQWAAETLRRYFPERRVDLIPHGGSAGMARPDAVASPLALTDDGRPVVAFLGAIGPDKGARRVERLVELTRERGLPLRWVLIGYLDGGRDPWQSVDGVFTMHGPYDSRALAELLDHYRVQLVAYPSVCPETFSFTLSEAWASGRPAIVPPIGALADRVAATGAGWVLSDDEWRSDERMLDRIAALLAPGERAVLDAAAARARAASLPTLTAMAERTVAVYRDALLPLASAPARAPIAVQRCLAALHYTPWWPPAAPQPAPPGGPASADMLARLARAALRLRHTLPGRVLYRLAPKSLLAALKARLSS
jgi:glycosyltransferase involved in cell wall biosynthesis